MFSYRRRVIAWPTQRLAGVVDRAGESYRSHIYRDEIVEVVRVIRGNAPDAQFTLRTVGGTVGDTQIVYEDWPTLVAGHAYLAFLEQVDTPTETGSELAWSLVWGGHGAFAAGDGNWANGAGKVTGEHEVTEASP